MIKRIDFFYIQLLFFMVISMSCYSQELIIDGNMENYSGHANFEYAGGGYTTLIEPFSGSSVAGNIACANNPKNFNFSFMDVPDHTSGIPNAGQMLIVDGSNLGNGKYFWRGGYGGNGFCGLVIGNTYTFSYWVRSVSSLVTNSASQADIKIDFSNATNILLVSGNTLAPLPSDGWQKVTYTFKATGYCVKINLWDNNIKSIGNDFALDDFSLLGENSLIVTYSISYGVNGIQVFPYYMGGNVDLVSITLTGPVNKNKNSYFDHLIPGNYVLTIVDADGATASCNVVIPFNSTQLSISGNSNICSGESTVLTASGGDLIYEWYSYPDDISITDKSSAVQTISPAVTTNYTVKSSYAPGTENLIYNGDFSLGNTGFGTWQKYLPTNFGNTSESYGVVKKSSDWDPNFLNCGDHTTGNGNMLVVNGSDNIFSDGDGRNVWNQTIVVNGTTDYVFSFWVKSLSNQNPAQLIVLINGSVYNIYPFDAPANNACGNWVKYSVNYFSGWMSNFADIDILDVRNTFIGNDFAIDDITFTALNSSSTYSNFVVTIDPSMKPVIKASLITENEIEFSFEPLSQSTGYQISYVINNGGVIDGGLIVDNKYVVNNLNPGDSVKLTVKPVGTGCFEAGEFTAITYLPCPLPVVKVVQQPTCFSPLGSIKLDTPIGNEYEYKLEGNNFQKDVLFTNLPEGDYRITIKNTITGCEKTSDLVSLNAPRAVLPNLSTSYSYKDCAVFLTASSTVANSKIVWNGPTLELNTPNPVKVNKSGKFTATITDLDTGCDFSSDLDVIMPNLPDLASFTTSDPTCSNSYGEIVVNSPLGSSYEYSIDGDNYQSDVLFSALPKTYYVTVKDIETACVSLPSQVVLTKPIIPVPLVSFDDYMLCKNSIASSLTATALPNATLNWYGASATGGTASSVPIVPSTSNFGRTIYYVSQSIDLCESNRASITVNVSGIGENPGFNDLSFCKGDIVPSLSLISPNGIKGTWDPLLIDNLETKSYHFTPSPNQCAVEQTIDVKINTPTLKTIDWEVSQAFGDFQTIKVKASDEGSYLYQLDKETPQNSPLFENVKRGFHSITVFDVNGCSNPVSSDKVLVINFPNYFTPNGDGYNEFWDISGLKLQNEASVFIYDRYGKLLKVLFPSKDSGWDGTYDGKEMPSSDYWFVVIYNENGSKEEYKGHFSLKR